MTTKSINPHALLLFAHGSRDPLWAEPFTKIRNAIQARRPELPVVLAFLELMRPTLSEAVDRLAAQGATHITLVPLFLARGGHLKEDVPRLVHEAGLRHPGVTIRMTEAIGESTAILDALAIWILAQHEQTS